MARTPRTRTRPGSQTPAPGSNTPAAEQDQLVTVPPGEWATTKAETLPDGVTITLPLADAPPASMSHHVRIDGNLRGVHGATLIRLRNGLNNQGARLRDGKFVQSYTEALRYLLEKIEEAA